MLDFIHSCLFVFITQLIVVYPIEGDDDYMMARIGDKFGRVPLTYIEMLWSRGVI